MRRRRIGEGFDRGKGRGCRFAHPVSFVWE